MMTGAIKRIENNKSQPSCYSAASVYTLPILFVSLEQRLRRVRKKERRDATAKFRQAKSRRSCIARERGGSAAATLARRFSFDL